MPFSIGFTAKSNKASDAASQTSVNACVKSAKKSVVQVYFAQRGMNLAYYNDMFDLHCGDTVYVDGKLCGMRGIVTDVNYNFKIKLSDYKRVIAVADTNVTGTFYSGKFSFITFDRNTLPKEKVLSWFKAPQSGDDSEIVSGYDDTSFGLCDISQAGFIFPVQDKGIDYYNAGRVKYICLDSSVGYALVEGREIYEIEFEYSSGKISGLVCSCYCGGLCKHEYAAMLALKNALEIADKHFSEQYARTGYFAAVEKNAFFSFAVNSKPFGSFTLA